MSKKNKPFSLIYEAEWNDIPCVEYPITVEKWVSESIRPLVGTQVDTLFYNLCSSDGYCCGLENGQILMDNFEKVGDAWVWRYRENTKKLIEADGNPPKLAVEYCRRLGMKAIPVVRMNDPHDQYFKYEVSEYKQKNPHLMIGYGKYIDWERGFGGYPDQTSMESFTWGMFNFKHEEVREHKFKIIEEFITRWDNDGVSLDFDRDPVLFEEEGKAENAEIMTNMIRRIRSLLDDLSKTRNKPLYLHVRVIPDLQLCWKRGMDVRAWVNEGLVDAVTPGCGYMTFSLDLKPWLDLVKDKDCWIYPSINHYRLPEITRAWAKWMYHQGAHGVYLFNWGHLLHGFDKNSNPKNDKMDTVYYDDLHPIYYEVLNQIGDVKTSCYKSVKYSLESIPHKGGKGESANLHRKFRGIGAIELPVELSVGTHAIGMPFAEDFDDAEAKGFLCQKIKLKLLIVNYTYPDTFDVYVNGKKLDNETRKERAVFIMNNDTVFEYPVDSSLLHIGLNKIVIDVHSINPQMEGNPILKNVDVIVEY